MRRRAGSRSRHHGSVRFSDSYGPHGLMYGYSRCADADGVASLSSGTACTIDTHGAVDPVNVRIGSKPAANRRFTDGSPAPTLRELVRRAARASLLTTAHAQGGTRTRKTRRSGDFESPASANSAT